MSTRITYRHRELARSILQEIIATQFKGVELSPEEAIIAFADNCLNIIDVVPLKCTSSMNDNLQRRMTKLIEKVLTCNPRDKPAWVAKTEVVLHLSERMLGILPSGKTFPSLDPKTVVHRQRSVAIGTYSTPNLIADKMSLHLLSALKADGPLDIDVADLSLEAGHFPISLLAQQTGSPVRFFRNG